MRIASTRPRLKACTSVPASLPTEIPSQIEHFQSFPIAVELLDLPPKILELLSKGVDLQLTLLVQQLETFEFPASHFEPFDTEVDPNLQTTELKATDFISSFTHTHPLFSSKFEE